MEPSLAPAGSIVSWEYLVHISSMLGVSEQQVQECGLEQLHSGVYRGYAKGQVLHIHHNDHLIFRMLSTYIDRDHIYVPNEILHTQICKHKGQLYLGDGDVTKPHLTPDQPLPKISLSSNMNKYIEMSVPGSVSVQHTTRITQATSLKLGDKIIWYQMTPARIEMASQGTVTDFIESTQWYFIQTSCEKRVYLKIIKKRTAVSHDMTTIDAYASLPFVIST